MFVHVLQHVLDTNLLAVADGPDAVELQPLDDGTLEDEYRRGTRARDEIDTLGIERGDGFGEYRMVVAGKQSDAVGADERGTILFAGVEDALFHDSTRLGFFAEACRDDDERPCALVACQQFDGVGTQLGGNDEDGQFGGWQFLGIVEHFDALYLVLFGIHHAQGTFESSLQNISYDGLYSFKDLCKDSNYF